MLQVFELEKTYGERTLFSGATFTIGANERIALVGRNGSGKSTLFRLILGTEQPDGGRIVLPKHYRVGHLAQHLKFTAPTILDEVCLGLPEGREEERYRGEIILGGLGFSEDDLQRPPSSFSGGFQIRVELARVLISEPNLLLLDEPTNYLDIVSARWLIEYLREWEEGLIAISHDRTFLDAISTHSMLIHRGQVRKMRGNTEAIYNQVEQDEEVHEKTRVNLEKKKREMEKFVNRFRAQAAKATLVQSKIKAIERLDIKEELAEEHNLDFAFRSVPFFGKSVIETENLSFGYNSDRLLIDNLSVSVRPGDRLCIIGKNGRGKSTLLGLLASELSANSGQIKLSPNAVMGYFGQSNIDRLDPKNTVEQEINSANGVLSRTQVRAIAGAVMFSGDNALKKVSVLSGGEKSRVMLGKILARPVNLLLLDEPTNHLDLESVQALKDAINAFDGTVIMVTHDELLIRELATKLIVFQGPAPFVFDGNYEYFLEKIGWEDTSDGGADLSPSSRDDVGDKSEKASKRKENDRRDRAKNRDERNRVLGPIKKKIDELEELICANEELVKSGERALVDASTLGEAEKIAELSKQVHEAKTLIENSFTTLETLVAEYDKLEGELEGK